MAKKATVPDAWEDDWESQADKLEDIPTTQPQAAEPALPSKAQRLAQHAEENKKIWNSAESPQTFHFLAAKDTIPLKQEIKPALKVLSRKPAQDDEDEDEQSLARNQMSMEERRMQAQKERDEKQKKYEEVRARLFGTTQSTSGSSFPGQMTPSNASDVRSPRGKGRSRGGRQPDTRKAESHRGKELFDPSYTPKPDSITIQRRPDDMSGRSSPRAAEQILRKPRGPEMDGRGGFNTVLRGSKGS